MNTPPDHPGGERSPIASTVPSPNRDCSRMRTTPAVASDPLADRDHSATRDRSGCGARPPIGRDALLTTRFVRPNASGPENGVATTPRKRGPKRERRAQQNYHRPFVAIEVEGQNYPGADIVYDGVRYPRHDTYLVGRGGGRWPASFVADGGRDQRPR